MELTLPILIVSSTCLAGLLGLWAGASRLPLPIRVGGVLAAISSLLVIPAYELVVFFLVQSGLAAVGAAVYVRRLVDAAGHPKTPIDSAPKRRRFSLKSLLGVTALVAWSAAVWVRLPGIGGQAWTIVATAGCHAGVQSLLGAWLAVGRARYWIRWPMVLVCSLAAIALWLGGMDQLNSRLSQQAVFPGYRPQPFGDRIDVLFGPSVIIFGEPLDLWWMWTLGLTASHLVLSALLTWLFQTAGWTPTARRENQRVAVRIVSDALSVALVIALIITPGWFYAQLANPTPIPTTKLPEPNGYTQLVAAGEAIKSPALADPDSVAPEVLAGEVEKYQTVLDAARNALRLPIQKPLDYRSSSDDLPSIEFLRTLARAIRAEGLVARQNGQIETAAARFADLIRLGAAASRGGLMIDSLVGFAITGIGSDALYDVHDRLSQRASIEAIEVLAVVERSLEPADEVIRRDRIWTEHGMGWQGRLEIALQNAGVDSRYENYEMFKVVAQREIVELRLLMTVLAVRAFIEGEGRAPETLIELVPDYLDRVPKDPYSGMPLRYQAGVVYSVGPDGIDDGGKLLDWEGYTLSDEPQGDLGAATFFGAD